jgi:hypothetical protein
MERLCQLTNRAFYKAKAPKSVSYDLTVPTRSSRAMEHLSMVRPLLVIYPFLLYLIIKPQWFLFPLI